MQGTAYIITDKDGTILFDGIVRNSDDAIYPAQEEPYLKNEYPTLPSEVELHHFNVPGLTVHQFTFDIPLDVLKQYKY